MSKTIVTPLKAIMSAQLKGVTVLNVFYELVANSLDAGATNVAIRIRKAGKDTTAGTYIEVKDDGRGILDSDLGKVINAMSPSDYSHKGLGRFVAAKCFGSVFYSSVAKDGFKRTFEICPDSDGTFTRDDIKVDLVSPGELAGTLVRTGKLSDAGTSKTKTKSDFLDPIYLKEKLKDHFLLKLKENPEITITIGSEADGVIFVEEILSAKDIGQFQEKVSRQHICDHPVRILWHSRQHEGKGVVETQAIVDGRGAKFERGISCAVTVPPNLLIRAFVQWNGLCVNSERGTAQVDDENYHDVFEKTLRKMLASIIQEAVPNLKREKEIILKQFEKSYPDLVGLVSMGDDFYCMPDVIATARTRHNIKKDRAVDLRSHGQEVPLEDSDDLQRRALAEYVQHRQDVILTLRKLVDSGSDEGRIHDLFMPRRMVADERSALCTNMWLLDDKYMSFQSLHSDIQGGVTVRRVGLSGEGRDPTFPKKEPDLMLLYRSSSGTNGLIIELKKPSAKPAENHDLTRQIVIGEDTLRNALGAEAQVDIYGVATIDDETAFVLKKHNYQPLYEGCKDVYVVFSPNGRTRKFIISYDKLIDDAKARNEIFLRVLQAGFDRPALPDISDLVTDTP
jgi:hypothetical protein